jgi:arginine/serine-rich splicing factor 7
MARSVPCFAFIVFRYREDAEDAQRRADGEEICGRRIRVTVAKPRTKSRSGGGRERRSFDPNVKCYQCGDKVSPTNRTGS